MLTDAQQIIIDTLKKHGGNISSAARGLGITRSAFRNALEGAQLKLAKSGITDSVDLSQHVAPGYKVKGVSTLSDADGNAKLRWVKTTQDMERQRMIMEASHAAMCETIPRYRAQKLLIRPGKEEKQLLNVYVITDYHLGMLAWGEESGDDWDINIAENILVAWFERSISLSPSAESAIFAQLGDFMHWDGFNAATPMGGHLLDADTRFQKLVRVAIRVIRRVIDILMSKYKTLTVIMAEGNHDMASSVWLRELMAALYEKEPRINVDVNPDPYYCKEHGDCSIFFHHGHKKRPKNIADVFPAKFREAYGRTKYSYAHMGHMHHNILNENNLMVVEQHRTLAASDAYASRGGWISGRDAKVITYHKDLGEVSRIVVSYNSVAGKKHNSTTRGK